MNLKIEDFFNFFQKTAPFFMTGKEYKTKDGYSVDYTVMTTNGKISNFDLVRVYTPKTVYNSFKNESGNLKNTSAFTLKSQDFSPRKVVIVDNYAEFSEEQIVEILSQIMKDLTEHYQNDFLDFWNKFLKKT